MNQQQIKDLCIELSDGNPGALMVSMELYRHYGQEPLQLLRGQGITGVNLYLLFKDVNGRHGSPDALTGVFNDLQDGSAVEKIRAIEESTL